MQSRSVYFTLIALGAESKVDVPRLAASVGLEDEALRRALQELVTSGLLRSDDANAMENVIVDRVETVTVDPERPILLVVEDDDFVRDGLAILFEDSRRYEVFAAKNGLHALEILIALPRTPDVVVVDVMMPVLGGPDLIDTLKRANRDVRTIVISAVSPESFRRSLPECEAFFRKPIDVERLLATVDRLCGGASKFPASETRAMGDARSAK